MPHQPVSFFANRVHSRAVFILLTIFCLWGGNTAVAWAEDAASSPPAESATIQMDQFQQMFRAGGVIGIIIAALSVAMVALIVEHLLSIRRATLMPPGLAEQTHQLIQQGQFKQAEQLCHEQPSVLGRVLSAGLAEVGLGYSAVEKGMEDASTEQAARLFRKIEYLSVIGTIAPMLGLLGTVWGMMGAFVEFESKANPQVSELAPGIYRALVTTLLGLGVAVPALAGFAIFRNRIDELVAESSLLAEHVFSDFKRSLAASRKADRQRRRTSPANPGGPSEGISSVAVERESPR